MDTPRAWVGCLACYNEGRLTGAWVDGVDAGDYVPCHRPMHEEWWVMDFEGYDGLLTGECSPMEAQALAELTEEIESSGLPVAAYGAYLANYGTGPRPDVEEVREAFEGEHESMRDFAMYWAEEICGINLAEQAWPLDCIDWNLAARDLQGFWSASSPGGIYVFREV